MAGSSRPGWGAPTSSAPGRPPEPPPLRSGLNGRCSRLPHCVVEARNQAPRLVAPSKSVRRRRLRPVGEADGLVGQHRQGLEGRLHLFRGRVGRGRPHGRRGRRAGEVEGRDGGIVLSGHSGGGSFIFGYINAHGTSTVLNDKGETAATKRVFGDHAYQLPISSTKSMVGHMLGAAGGIEAVFLALSIRDQIAPPTINLHQPSPECDLDYVPNTARKMTIRYGLSNSFGFGGTNGVVIFKQFTG